MAKTAWTQARLENMSREQIIPALELGLARLEDSSGGDHPDAIRIRHQLAHAYRAAQRYDQAVALFGQNVTACARVYGPVHPITLRRRSSLANCYYAAGRYAEAIPRFEGILLDREAALGDHHPDTLRSRGSLANCYRVSGRQTP
jgi:tetratricopeptide (TPR) repeat protein